MSILTREQVAEALAHLRDHAPWCDTCAGVARDIADSHEELLAAVVEWVQATDGIDDAALTYHARMQRMSNANARLRAIASSARGGQAT